MGNKGIKKWLTVPVALLLLALLALPVFAASARVEETLAQLEYLQGVDISPEWDPDVRANQAAVQTLLDLYQACTDAEKQAFTTQQKADLRAYFEALYRVQGKNEVDVAALFTTGAASSSKAPSSSASSSASGSDADADSDTAQSSQAASSAASSAPSSKTSAPVGSGTASMPYTGSPGGQTGGGWFAIFGNRALGSLLLVVLMALIAVLLVRFLVALRRAGRAPQGGFGDDIRAQELFGENYEPMLPDGRGPALNTESGSPPLRPQQAFQSVDFSEPEDDMAEDYAEEEPEKKGWLARRREKKQQAQDSAFDGDLFAPAAEDDPFAFEETPAARPARSERAPLAGRAAEPRQPEEDAAPSAGDTFGAWLDRTPDELPAQNPPESILPEERSGAAPDTPAPRTRSPRTRSSGGRSAQSRPAGGRGQKPAPDIGGNPDVANSIAMRSFSAQPRNGRPAKMTFRQGDPEDLDAIDE